MGFEAIIPDSIIFDPAAMEDAFTSAVDDTLRTIQGDFEKTVATWKTQPEFAIESAHNDGDSITGSVSTDNPIYAYVNNGTEPHVIRPRVAKKLHFLSGYQAKTSHRVVGSHAGGASGEDVFANEVHHPGTEAREFDKEIADRRQRTLENNVSAAILRALRG